MMRGLLTLTTARTFDAVTLTEAKAHLRVDHDDEDDLIEALIDAAHEVVERETGIVLASSSWRLTLPDWPINFVDLRPGPLVSITSVQYYDANDSLQTLSSSYYRTLTDSMPGRLEWVENLTLPTLSTRDSLDVVRVTYVQGYATAADIPKALKQACLLLVGHYFEHREDAIAGTIISTIPRAAASLMSIYSERRAHAT